MPKYSYFNNKDKFIMSEFDENYKFKGFKPEQFYKESNKYMTLRGAQVSEDGENAVILLSAEHVFPTRYGYGVIVDANHVVWIKDWQVWGQTRNNHYVINFSKTFYQVKEYGGFSDSFSYGVEDSLLGTFDSVVKIANEQTELRSTQEGREKASDMGFSLNWEI